MNYEQARFNMIEQQIRPWDVLDSKVLSILTSLKREQFAPRALRDLAFADTEIPLGHGQTMLSPKLEARLLQAAAPSASDTVLEIGTGSGFMAALLAQTAAKVVSCETLADLAESARRNLHVALCDNVRVETGCGFEYAAHSIHLWDLIVLSGSISSVAALPSGLIDRLAPGGRLIGVFGELSNSPMQQALLIQKGKTGDLNTQVLFDTAAPILSGVSSTQFNF